MLDRNYESEPRRVVNRITGEVVMLVTVRPNLRFDVYDTHENWIAGNLKGIDLENFLSRWIDDWAFADM